ncbi:MAG: hypothetical protein J6N15_12835 [Ruminiclostridium sp.]|nr:hypothetical protein [Ruminiclostridium sp.]
MRFSISSREELSRTEKRYRVIKWATLSLLMIVFYVMMRAGIFGLWQPVFIIPLCAAVSMHEDELSSCIFALFCGFMIDMASGYVFGFSAIWLMTVSVVSSLLVRNLIRVNLINFCIIAAAAVFIEYSMDYLFNILIWNIPKGEVILVSSIIPTAAATMVVSPAVYYLVRSIETRLASESMNTIDYDDDDFNGEQGDEH